MNRLKKYSSKVLLFGEYTVLSGGQALAVPVKNLTATWRNTGRPDDSLNDIFYQWCNYLKENAPYISVGRLKKDWEKGFRFVTDILTGYGVGSSGVLTAIVFDRYRKTEERLDIDTLKEQLGVMESFFHGQSSGLDPLVSYLDKPVVIAQGRAGEIRSQIDFREWEVYLLDSGQRRSTADLVPLFRQKMSEKGNFHSGIENVLKKHVSEIIRIILQDPTGDFSGLLKQISLFQWENMQWLIHDNIKQAWEKSLSDPHSAVKICGAGGGGYYLMFSREKIKNIPVPFIGPLNFV